MIQLKIQLTIIKDSNMAVSTLYCVRNISVIYASLLLWTLCYGYEYDYKNGEYMRDGDPDAWGMDVRSITHRRCVPIPADLKLCQDVEYVNMSVPNLLGHDTVEEAKRQANPWVALKNVGCHPNLDLFLCSLYAPVCLDRPIFPCQSLCESVKFHCEGYMNKYGFVWPNILHCDKFPTGDSLCIKQLTFINTTAANVCEPCKKPMTFESLLDSYCWSTYVLKVKIRKVVDDGNGDKLLVTKRKIKSYKPKSIPKKDKKNLKLIIQNGTNCDCEVAEKAKKSSLVMASKVGDKFVVTYVGDWIKNKEFKRAIRAIRKGHDCKVKIDPDQTDASNGGLSINGSPLPTVNGPVAGKDRKKKKKDRGKGKDKGKDKDKNKKKKDDEDPMANFAGIGCIPCKQPLVFENLITKYCDSNFVMKVRVKKIEMDDNGDKRLVIKKTKSKDIYKQENISSRELKKLQPVIAGGSSCDCQNAAKGKKLFVMGQKEGLRNVLNFLIEDENDSEFKRFLRAIKKGYDCTGVPKNE
ncbi:secreted frizzled-related protein 1-like isoform X2 [Mercenaria mercenaria]|uniref:secreted frizzled-related protein 1-like isoform X2 n=1 Tax=Mercenaria mercenaria TaxID=6596 RepID=UPI00234E3C54|nr:secreted frizzled-related protein 1-like isoform X2 [Mercenaria mercenaria]